MLTSAIIILVKVYLINIKFIVNYDIKWIVNVVSIYLEDKIIHKYYRVVTYNLFDA